MIKLTRNQLGGVLVESAIALPIFIFLVFTFIEFSRAAYVKNTLTIAAQQAASKIGINSRRRPGYNVSGFRSQVSNIRFPGSVVSSDQFDFDVVNVTNGSTVNQQTGQADGATSTKVVVTVKFPPPNRSIKIPIFDPGNLIRRPIFGRHGLRLESQAYAFLERSRRPIVN